MKKLAIALWILFPAAAHAYMPGTDAALGAAQSNWELRGKASPWFYIPLYLFLTYIALRKLLRTPKVTTGPGSLRWKVFWSIVAVCVPMIGAIAVMAFAGYPEDRQD